MISFFKKTISGLTKTRKNINKLFSALSGKTYLGVNHGPDKYRNIENYFNRKGTSRVGILKN